MPRSSDVRETARKYAIKNAMDYGKADFGAVISKVISRHPEAKGDIKLLSAEVKAAVKDANSMPKASLESAYSKYAEEFESDKRSKAERTAKPKFVLDGAKEGELVVRTSPEPSGYMHIGHAKQALLNEEFARVYKGRLYLYFDDTNPEKASQEYVDAMKLDMAWLGLKFDSEYYASDSIETMYSYARQLLASGKAYVCACDKETIAKSRMEGAECAHRSQDSKKNAAMFEDMLGGKAAEGTAIVRFMGDMKSQNTALRDPALLRVLDAPHYRTGTKYRVWPLYDFNTPIMDSIKGITDVIRSKEYELRDELDRRILESLGLRVPRPHLEARLNIKGNITQKRVLRQLITERLVESWDDPRLMTIMALRRRGVLPAAIREFVLRFGMSKTDSTVGIDMLLAENKKLVDPTAKHFFFVRDPVRLAVKGAVPSEVRMKLHPAADFGYREYKVDGAFYVSADDAKRMKKGTEVRLKDLMAVKIISNSKSSISAEPANGAEGAAIVQWVPEGSYSECSVLIPGPIVDDEGKFNPDSLETAKGYVEKGASALNERETVQFERFGYCTLDSKEQMRFIFLSK